MKFSRFHVSTVTDPILKEIGDNKKVNIQPDIVFLLINVFQVYNLVVNKGIFQVEHFIPKSLSMVV